MKDSIKFCAVLFFPILFPLLSIWSFFSDKEYRLWLVDRLAQWEISVRSMSDLETWQALLVSFERNRGIYLLALFSQALLFILLAYIFHLFIKKKKRVLSIKAKVKITSICFVLGHMLNVLPTVVAYQVLWGGRQLPYIGDHHMLLTFQPIFSSWLLLGANPYVLYGFIGIFLQIYIFCVIWIILAKANLHFYDRKM